MIPEDDLEQSYARFLPRHPDAPAQKLYCGIVEHVRGSVIVTGTSNANSDVRFIAQPLQPLRDLDDPVDAAVLERLRREVVRTTHYVDYVWTDEDD